MYNYLFKFTPSRFDDYYIAGFTDALDEFFSSLVRNGLIIEGWRNSTVIGKSYECHVAAFDLHSLLEDNFNAETKIALKQLYDMCEETPKLEYVGVNSDLEGSCSCEHPTHLVLFSHMDAQTSPVICCNCKKGFPLRRFRLRGQFDNFDRLLEWQRLYRSFKTQYECGVGETFAYMMMHRFDSQLAVEGRLLAQQLEDSAGIIVYYFIFKDRAKNPDTCPECGRPWVSRFPDAVGFSHCCEYCRLVSNNPQ
jgi:predicted  nucleic acid-binding Zn ribbon protein